MNDTQSTSKSTGAVNPVQDVSVKIIKNLHLIKVAAQEEGQKIEDHLRRDVGFLITAAQTFANHLMPFEQKKELMDWIEQIKQRHGF